MSLRTFSVFYYGHTLTDLNNRLDFTEGAGPELTATLNVGDYSLTEFVAELKRALDVAGALTYTVTLSRSTRKITIATTSTFSLLTTSGSHFGTSVFTLAGFSGADKTGAPTYQGDAGSGTAFTPQFILQDHKPSTANQRAIEATVHKTGSGKVQVTRFGVEKFVQCRIRFSTNIYQTSNSRIRNNPTGVADLEAFMQYMMTKAKAEYMPNESAPDTFETVILESTEESSQGTGFELRERYDINIPGYFDSSILKLKVLE